MSLKTYEELIIWQKSMDLVVEIYCLTKQLPKEELYGIISQMRRAAISIPSNIAEGYSRNSRKEYVQFIYIARGSKSELETQLKICERLGYLSNEQIKDAQNIIKEISKMFNVLLKNLPSTPQTLNPIP